MTPRPRPGVERMTPYTPGEQPGAGDKVIKLNTNENPYPPSPRVMEAIQTFDPEWLRRYPNATADAFRDEAARLHGVGRDMIIAGNGSDEILALVVRAFVGPGEAIAWPEPTYSLYPVLAEIGEARGLAVPWDSGWQLPSEALLRAGARAVFFANPNAPSGTLVPVDTIRALARRLEGLLLVDEAYIDFCELAGADSVALVADCPNLLVSRTLSKGYALCGLRLGYAVAAPAVVSQMMKVKDSYNCNAIAIAAGRAALLDRGYAASTWQAVRDERARVSAELERRSFVVVPSQANFVLATVPGGDGGACYRRLKQRGILVRHFDKPGLADKVRITIGRRDENDALLAALDQDGGGGFR
jgi:histidinol-phosphate aminotransferase